MRLRFVLLLVASCVLIGVRAPLAAASTLKVCPNGCAYSNIQSAINAAQTGDIIKISPGTYTETLLVAPPVAAKALTLKGQSAKKTIVDGSQQGTVLEVGTDYAVDIADMTFTNGKDLPVGGIFNHGTMKLTNVTVTKNEGTQTAGGIANDIDGTLMMSRTVVSDNQSSGVGARGGGFFNVGTASVADSTISGNSALMGGGVENSGTLVITNSDLIDNTSPTAGGALDNRKITGATANAIASLKNCRISGNAAFTGGGIYNISGLVAVSDTPFRGNTANEGGAVENSIKATTQLRNSPVVRNVANVNAGGVGNDGGTLTLIDSPIKNNAVTSDAGALGGGVGVFGGTVTLKRSPVVHNSVSGPIGGQGGGIAIINGASLTLQNSRVTDNTASTDGGGIYALTGTVTFQGASPVRRNHPNNCVNVSGC